MADAQDMDSETEGHQTMTIEALWAVDFESQGGLGAGVAVFETERVFGGDSGWYYTGRYKLDRNEITARIRVRQYGGSLPSVTGHSPGETFEIDIVGTFDGSDHIEAVGTVVDPLGTEMRFSMRRLENLP